MAFLGLALITAAGYAVIRLVGLRTGPAESVALGWLVGSPFVTFIYFWMGIAGWSALVYIALCVAAIKFSLRGFVELENTVPPQKNPETGGEDFKKLSRFIPLLWILIAAQLFYGFYSLFNLPTRFWDSFDGWHIRARIFVEEVAFGPSADPAFLYGGINLHYPMHLPLLKAFICNLAGGWSDAWAASVDVIGFAAFLVVAYKGLSYFYGSRAAVVGIYIITSIPFVGIHLSAGYADLTVAVFLASSAIYWQRFRLTGDARNLVISGIFIAACAWTKNDAMILYLPVMLFAALIAGKWSGIKVFLAGSLLPLLPWIIFKNYLGFGYGPNQGAGEATIEFHSAALRIIPFSIYEHASFGIFWILFLSLLFFRPKTGDSKPLWFLGWACLGAVLAVFTFTPAFKFLYNNMTFQRSLLQVFPLLVIASTARVCDILKERRCE